MPVFVARLDLRTRAPAWAITIQAGLAILLVAVGTFDAIVAYFVFATVAFLGSRREKGEPVRLSWSEGQR